LNVKTEGSGCVCEGSECIEVKADVEVREVNLGVMKGDVGMCDLNVEISEPDAGVTKLNVE
jgi:hypothetical protein